LIPKKRGRKATFSEEEEKNIIEGINSKNLELQLVTTGNKGTLEAFMKESIRTRQSNKHAVVELSAKTIQKYITKWNLRKVEARRKNTGRISAYNNIRTPISLCCLMHSLQRLLIESSVDDVSNLQIQCKIICKL
jgi:hypothetical protein